MMVESGRKARRCPRHILLSGHPVPAKPPSPTIIANAMGVNVKTRAGRSSKSRRAGGVLTSLEKGDVLFIDEIHRLQPTIEEYLYSGGWKIIARHHYRSGPTSRSLRLPTAEVHAGRRNPRGPEGERATALTLRDDRAPRYTAPMRCKRSSPQCASPRSGNRRCRRGEIAARARGTRAPRIIASMGPRLVQVKAQGKITGELADRALPMLEIDRDGSINGTSASSKH